MHIATERLVIRSWTEADLDPYAAIVGKASVMRYIGTGQPDDRGSARRFIAEAMEQDRAGKPTFWAVEVTATQALIGFCGFGRCQDEVDMGWRYDDASWGKGYGSEAALAVLEHGVKEFGFTRIIARADPDNAGSIKIMRKMGFIFEREVANGVVRRAIYSYTRR